MKAFRNLLIVCTVLAIGYWIHDLRTEDAGTPDGSASAEADPLVVRSNHWAPPGRAKITPGTQTITAPAGARLVSQCTSNFVFTDAADHVYLGEAAHCAETTKRHSGCDSGSLPLGTPVQFTKEGAAGELGHGWLAYSSWLTMQKVHEKDPATCLFNDFALIRVAGKPRDFVNPTMPHWGGPDGLAHATLMGTERVYSVGKSSLRKVGSKYAFQAGRALTDKAAYGGWSHTFYAVSPGIPGDSGSGYISDNGLAIGTLSTLTMGQTLLNTMGDLSHELDYARRHSGIRGLRLELGTVPFNATLAQDAP